MKNYWKQEIQITRWRLVIGTICFILMGICLGASLMPAKPVNAAGNTTTDIYVDSDDWSYMSFTNPTCPETWYGAIHATSVTNVGGDGNDGRVGWQNFDSPAISPISTMMAFDISGIDSEADIMSMTVYLKCTAKTDTSDEYSNFYFSLWATNPGSDNDITADDWDNMYTRPGGYARITSVYEYTDLSVGNWIGLEIQDLDTAMQDWNDTGLVYYYLVTEYHSLNFAPTWENGYKAIYADFDDQVADPAYVEVVYAAPADPRDPVLHTNAAIDTTIIGNEVADNVTLETLACMYADETLSFLVNGDSGANVTLELLDQDGAILDTHDDSVRTDGVYSWQVEVASDYDGFVRVKENNFNLLSPWVSVQPSPASSQYNNTVYARYTNYTQYSKPYSGYVVDDGDLMYIHWKTNIDGAAELADYDLEIYSNGYSSIDLFTEDLDTYADDYFSGSAANQAALMHWRYAVFSPGITAGMSDYGGLVQDLELDQAKSIRRGFIEAIIQDNTDNTTLAGSHSAYWYLSAPDQGISVSLSRPEYSTTESIQVNLNIGSECKVETNLSGGRIEVLGRTNTYFTAALGNHQIEVPAISVPGDYTARLHLSDSSHTDYEYVYDMSFTVSEDGGGAVVPADTENPSTVFDRIMAMIGIAGLDTEGGRWIAILLGMVALAVIFWKMPLLAVSLPLVLLGAGIASKWIDPWIVVALALGAGVFLYGLFRKKSGLGGGSNE